jgi:hypothetical protein
MILLYLIYFMYPLWFLGLLTTDNGWIFGILFMLHSAYTILFTFLSWFFNDPYSFFVNLFLIMCALWVYNNFLIN